jgi:hypothetical protein
MYLYVKKLYNRLKNLENSLANVQQSSYKTVTIWTTVYPAHFSNLVWKILHRTFDLQETIFCKQGKHNNIRDSLYSFPTKNKLYMKANQTYQDWIHILDQWHCKYMFTFHLLLQSFVVKIFFCHMIQLCLVT